MLQQPGDTCGELYHTFSALRAEYPRMPGVQGGCAAHGTGRTYGEAA